MEFNPYLIVIAISVLIILSFLYNLVSTYTRIPSVLLLILTGIGISQLTGNLGMNMPDLFPVLEVLGVVGLLMILLEGALDLKLEREKAPMILKAFLAGLLILVATAFGIAFLFQRFLDVDFYHCLIYAVPLSVISSAIVIPSVTNLVGEKREFLIYDATFSDLLGIMFFDFLIIETVGDTPLWAMIAGNIGISLIASIVLSIGMVLVMQKVKSRTKLILFISVLALVFATGKYFHFSALLLVLFFGLTMENPHLVFRGPLKRFWDKEVLSNIKDEFVMITEESAFFVRTLFFVVFGMTMDLKSLADPSVILVGVITLVIIYVLRTVFLRTINGKDIFPDIFMAPRGLITILLFYKIPEAFEIASFETGVIFFVILGSSVVMSGGNILQGKREKKAAEGDVAASEREKGLVPEATARHLEKEGGDDPAS